jgi:hypothetical protein
VEKKDQGQNDSQLRVSQKASTENVDSTRAFQAKIKHEMRLLQGPLEQRYEFQTTAYRQQRRFNQ